MAAFSRLNSNCGVESLQLEFIECRDCGPDPGVDCSVLLVGSHWSADEIKQVRVDLSCLHLSLAAISALASELGRWVSLPLERMAQEAPECEYEVAFAPPSSPVLRLGERADTISARKPVLTAAFSAGSLTGELHFVTDQSCIAQFVAGLQEAQRALGYP